MIRRRTLFAGLAASVIVGRKVRYQLADLQRYLAERRTDAAAG